MNTPSEARLEAYGYDDFFRRAFEALFEPAWAPARIIRDLGDHYDVAGPDGDGLGRLVGALRRHARDPLKRPAVGDWVAVEPGPHHLEIRQHLEPRTRLIRQAADRATRAQVMAANVDRVFIVTSLDGDLEPRRLERYLATVAACGASATIVATKKDKCGDLDAAVAEIREAAPDTDLVVTSAHTGDGIDALWTRLLFGETVVMVGSSGVGKSTLMNVLLGEERQATNEVRDGDDKGRHTTTRRELVSIPKDGVIGGGGLLIDTPGIRELRLYGTEGADVEAAFDDIEALAEACRFNDCAHRREPGCAVQAAVEAGELADARLLSFFKLEDEAIATQRRMSEHERRAYEKQFGRVVTEAIAKKRSGQ